jgi:hypothetical protein
MRAPFTALFCLTLAVSAYGQEPVSPPSAVDAPAHLAFIEGGVDVIHEGLAERADPPVLLVDGDTIRTANGRAEIVFGDGTLLHLDHSAELEILAPQRLRLLEGRAIVRVSAAARGPYVVDTPGGSVRLDGRGEFTVTATRSARLDVRTTRGVAEIDDGAQRVIVRAGEMVTLAGPGSRADFRAYNSAQWDSFEVWANDRANGSVASVSASRLPSELRVYGSVLDDHGRWEYLTPYGYVWYPAVAGVWRPYYDGSWAHTRYGWTWHGRDRWAWPTHHYGRWGFNGAAWFWIPKAGWGPAWVSWGHTAGYVSWAPLGWDGQPAIGLYPRRDHPAYGPRYDPWRGWTVVPRHQFGPRRPIRPRAIDGNRLDAATRGSMIIQSHGPGDPVRAVPRGSLTVAGNGNTRRDEPRDDRPGYVRRPTAGGAAPAEATAAPGPQRRATDAPEYTPTYRLPTPDSWRTTPASRDTDTAADRDGARGGRVRAADPARRASPADDDRPVVTAPATAGDGGRDANRAVPRGGVVTRSPRDGGAATQGGERTGARGGGGQTMRGGGTTTRGSDGARSGGSDSGARSRSGGASISSGGTSGGGGGATAGAPSGGRSSGGAVRRPR